MTYPRTHGQSRGTTEEKREGWKSARAPRLTSHALQFADRALPAHLRSNLSPSCASPCPSLLAVPFAFLPQVHRPIPTLQSFNHLCHLLTPPPTGWQLLCGCLHTQVCAPHLHACVPLNAGGLPGAPGPASLHDPHPAPLGKAVQRGQPSPAPVPGQTLLTMLSVLSWGREGKINIQEPNSTNSTRPKIKAFQQSTEESALRSPPLLRAIFLFLT